MRSPLRRTGAALLVVVALAGAGCGKDEPPLVKPAEVPDGLVPPTVQGETFAFFESTTDEVKNAFANAGESSLAADGRLWELRKADRLVGALQLSTLLPEVDLAKRNHREQILAQLLPNVRDEIIVDDVNVYAAASNGKTLFVFFSENMFALLTLKGGSEDNLDAEVVLGDVINFATQSESWKPLYIDEEEEEEEEV